MRANKYGKIVNMSSIAAKACSAVFSVYICTKSAVLSLTSILGRETDIRTSMWEDILDQMAGSEDATREKVWNACNNVTPNGKPQEPIDIAYMTAFLCTDEARYITSQNIGVDGGYTF